MHFAVLKRKTRNTHFGFSSTMLKAFIDNFFRVLKLKINTRELLIPYKSPTDKIIS